MPIVSPVAWISFLAIVVFVAFVFLLGVRSARASMAAAVAIIVVWLGVPAILAWTGALSKFDRTPPPFLIFIGAFTVATAVVAFSKLGGRLIENLDIRYLAGFQLFRIAVEWNLHRLYEEGVAPIQMTYAGYNFDIVSGILGGVILIWGMTKQPPRWAIWAFNLIGLGLLINIVAIAMVSTPTPLRMFTNEPANTFVAYLPFVWLPSFLVQAAWFGHLIVFRWLGRSRASG
jgi:hypothetical protein